MSAEKPIPHKLTLPKALAFAWTYWKKYPFTVGLAGFLALSAPMIADVVTSIVFGKVVNIIANPPGGVRNLRLVLPYFLIHVFCWCYYWYGLQLRNWVRNRLDSQTLRHMCFDVFAHIQKLNVEWHTDTLSGATVRAISRGMWGFDEFGNVIFNNFIPIIGVSTSALIVLLIVKPIFGLIMGGFGSVYIFVSFYLAIRYLAPQQQKATRKESRISGVIADALTANATVKSFATEAREEQTVWTTLSNWSETARKAWDREVKLGTLQMTIMIGFRITYFCTAFYQWHEGTLTVGDFVFLIGLQFDVFSYFRDIGTYIRTLQKSVSDMEEAVLLLKMPGEPSDQSNAGPLKPDGDGIEWRDVTFGYGDHTPLYQNLSLHIKAGQSVALVGRSGSGKSTFVKLLLRFHDINTGSITINGQDIRHVTRESLRRSIALVPQEPILFHRTIGENISYAKANASAAEIEKAAQLAHAHEFIRELPKGYDTLVGERGIKLSGGERQRVAIARAILADSPILILDEATSSLDTESEQYIQEALEWLMKHRTTIIIAHRLSTIRKADRVLVFDHGRVVEDGNHAELLEKPDGMYRRMYTMQSGGFLADDKAAD